MSKIFAISTTQKNGETLEKNDIGAITYPQPNSVGSDDNVPLS
jgi:hypothetical protein